MKKLLILLLGLLALALLGYFCAYKKHGPAVQTDIHSRATAALAQEGLDWANASVDGRNIILTGIAPDQAAKDQAGEIAQIYGYNLIDNQITIATAQTIEIVPAITDPYLMSAVKGVNGKITLSGYVPDATARADLLAMATDRFGENNVFDQLEITPGAPVYWLPSIKAGMSQLDYLDWGQVEWHNEKLTVSGQVASDQVEQQMLSQQTRMLPDAISASLNLTIPEPAAVLPEPVVTQAPIQLTEVEKVAAISCQAQFAKLLSRNIIVFRTSSAELAAESYGLLDQLAEAATDCPAANVQIEGHTDSRGSAAYNLDLSQRRAQSVVDYLVSKAVDPARFTAIGFGEDLPIADNNTEEGRTLNRRIEFNVKGL